MSREFWEGYCVAVFIAVSLVVLLTYIGRAWVYADNHQAQKMTACVQNGYSWGECYNVIEGNQTSFTK